MRIKNISPLGDVEVPLLGRIVKAAEIIDRRVSFATWRE